MKTERATSDGRVQGAVRVALNSRASLHLIDDEGIVLDRPTQRIFRLSRTSTLIWCCLAEGWSIEQVLAFLASRCGLSPESASDYVASALEQFCDVALGDAVPVGGTGTDTLAEVPELRLPVAAMSPPAPHRPARYGILDCCIEVQGLPLSLADEVDEAMGDVASSDVRPDPVICTLVRTAGGYALIEGERMLGRCAEREGVVPMAKAVLTRVAIEHTAAFAVMHAASVSTDGGVVVLPGPAGSGKSTLAAALMLDGWTLTADDTTILDSDLTVRPLPTSLCLKAGSWPVLAAMVPGLERVAVHRREDGHSVRYLRPSRVNGAPAAAMNSSPMRLIAFPQYRAGQPLNVRRLKASEALDRLLPQFYPVSNRFNRDIMDRLIELVSQVPAAELCYSDAAAAVNALRTWPGTWAA